jgi:hypothetical protein
MSRKFYREVISIQIRIRNQLGFNKSRMDYLQRYWESEVLTYKFALTSSSKEKHRMLLR